MSLFRFLTDENFESAIFRGLVRRNPQLDILCVQDYGLSTTDDPIILEWAAQNNRIVLTHDLRTMPNFAYDRIAQNLPMPGVIVMRPDIRIGTAIDDLLMILECSMPDEFQNIVLRLPL